MLCEQGLFSELLLRKDGGMAGCWDMRTCVDMEVHMCTGGGQSQKQGCSTSFSTGQLGAVCEGGRIWSMWYVCMNVGARTWMRTDRCMWCCWAGCFLLSWHRIVPGWWSSQQQGCNSVCRGSKLCVGDCVQLCALVHTGCTQQDRFSAALMVRLTGFVVDVGDQDF